MASIKAKKGNPFEKLVAYNLQQVGFDVERIDDNTAGVDLVASSGKYKYYVECKHHKAFSWNKLIGIFKKTDELAQADGVHALVVFRANRQPVCIMYYDIDYDRVQVCTFEDYFLPCIWSTIPKGTKIWKN